MSRFRNSRRRPTPTISTQSLPDIIFMLLFFFMVTTHLRDSSTKLQVNKPQSEEQVKLAKKRLSTSIYIGKPQKEYVQQFGSDYCIQLNDHVGTIKDIAPFIEEQRRNCDPNDLPYFTVSLRIDQQAPMGMVNDVKNELRKVGALRVSYSTNKEVK